MSKNRHISRRLKWLVAAAMVFATTVAWGQTYSLDSCRAMAINHNKRLLISNERIRQAGYQRDQAFAAYLPQLDFTGAYLYNQRKLSIFDSDQLLPTKTFNPSTGQYEFNLVRNPETGQPVISPSGEPIPETVALIPKSAMTYDIHNVFFGAITLTQPIFMGGKIVALNKLSHYAQELAERMHQSEAENLIYAVDAAYWQVVSLKAKEELAESYLALLDTLHYNVNAMIEQGVATPNDLLQVEVKQNSANVDMVKVRDGLSLSRMALAQLCGLPVDTQIRVEDETRDYRSDEAILPATNYDMEEVYDRRPDIEALRIGINMRRQQANIARAAMMPNLALIGSYEFSNPNFYDGFSKKFKGAFSVGAMLTVPLWHWGGTYNAWRASRSEVAIAELELEDARDLVTLQVNQASFRCREAQTTLEMTQSNINAAEENLRQANLGYTEGVMTLSTVMEAQTAWLKARSEYIDAVIDVRLCDTYLEKSLGRLTY